MKVEIKGNELGWILKLAEIGYNSEKFRKFIKENKLKGLDASIKALMVKFYPGNFYTGYSNTMWILIREIKNDSSPIKKKK